MAKREHIEKLPNAPLQEVVFELLWEMDYDSSGRPFDQGFEFAQGIFAEKIKKEFHFHKRTIPEGFPLTTYPKPIHQFWKGVNEWPVIQIGPGILTINDIEKNYTWKEFKKLVTKTIKVFINAYKKELKFIISGLKYIDAVEIGENDFLTFINDNFNIKLTNNFVSSGKITNVKINETFFIKDIGDLDILISSGMSKNSKPSVIWQSKILKRENFSFQDIIPWVDKAHAVVSEHFKQTIKDSFYASFNEPQ